MRFDKEAPKGKLKEYDEDSNHLIEKTAIEFYGEILEKKDFEVGKAILSPKENAPFTFEEIEPVKKAEANSAKEKNESKTRIFDSLPSDVELLSYEEPVSIRKSPSHQEDEEEYEASGRQEISGKESSEKKNKLSANEFGTLIHDYLRAQAEGQSPETYEPPLALFKQISDEEIAKNKALCVKMCDEFAQSPLGKSAFNSKDSALAQNRRLEAELEFKFFYEGFIWTGSIDLLFQNADGTCTIVDYKSDSEIKPEKHAAQLRIYKAFASRFLQIPEEKIICKLWYLRHGREVEL